MERVVEHALASICELLGTSSSAVFMLDETREAAVMRWVCKDGRILSGKNDTTHPSGGQPLPKGRVLTWEKRFGPKACPYLIDIASHPEVSEEIRSWAQHEGYSTILTAPLLCGDILIGSLSLRFRADRRIGTRDMELAQSLANQAALLLGLAQRVEKQEEAALLEERNRMAGVMHDTVAQGLAGIIVRLDMALRTLGHQPETRAHLETAGTLARETLAQARRSVWDLGEATLEERDLVRALERLAKEGTSDNGARIAIKINGVVPALPYRISDNLFQIAREAVANALRHADARTILITLTVHSSGLRLDISDDGRGFVTLPKVVRRGFGLNIMERRAKSLGGEFSSIGRLGEGAAISVKVPLTSLNV